MQKTQLEKLIKEYEQSLWFFQREDARIKLLKEFLEQEDQQLLSDDDEISYDLFKSFWEKRQNQLVYRNLFTPEYFDTESNSAIVFRKLLYKKKEEKGMPSGVITKGELEKLILAHDKSKWFFQSDDARIKLLKEFLKLDQNKNAQEISYSAFEGFARSKVTPAKFNELFSEKYLYSGSRGANVILKFKMSESVKEEEKTRLAEHKSGDSASLELKRSTKSPKELFIALGCNEELFDKIAELKVIDLKKLYGQWGKLDKAHREKLTKLTKDDLWQVLCLYGEPKAIQYGIEHQIITSKSRNQFGETPLHLLAQSGNVSGAKWLMSHLKGINPNGLTIKKETPLLCAAKYGHAEFAIYAMEPLKNDPKQKTDDNHNALDLFSAAGSLAGVKLALDKFKIKPSESDVQDAFRSAVQSGNIDLVKYLIKYFKLNKAKIEKFGGVAEAAQYGYKEIINFLVVQCGVDPNAPDPKGNQRPPLYFAIESNQFESIRELFQQGVNIRESRYEGVTAFELAIDKRASLDILSFLATHLPDSNLDDLKNSSVFFSTAQNQHFDGMRILINLGFDPYSKNSQGQTVFDIAYQEKDLVKREKFLTFLFATLKLDPDKFLVLHAAAVKNDLPMMKKMVTEYKIDRYTVDSLGNTALHLAAEKGHHEAVWHLIDELNLDPMAKNKAGQTTLHKAVQSGNWGLVLSLRERFDFTPFVEDILRTPSLSQNMKDALNQQVTKKSDQKAQPVEQRTASLSLEPTDPTREEKKPIDRTLKPGEWEEFEKRKRQFEQESKAKQRRETEAKAEQEKRAQLLNAIKRDQLAEIKKAIEEKSLDALTVLDDQGMTVLHYAAKEGSRNVLNYLLNEAKWSPEVQDKNRKTPLMYAIQSNKITSIGMLVNAKAEYPLLAQDLCAQYKRNKAEFEQFKRGDQTRIEYFIDKYKPNLGELFYLIVEAGDVDLAVKLAKKMDVNDIQQNRIPLLYAIENKKIDLVRFLLQECKADISIRDAGGRNALHYAVMADSADLVEMVRAYGAKPIKDNDGFSPEHLENAKKDAIKKALTKTVPAVKVSQVPAAFGSPNPGDKKQQPPGPAEKKGKNKK